MNGLSVIDETFDPNISSSYFISIQVSLDGFSFCTLDPVRNKYIQLRHIPFSRNESLVQQIEKCFEETELLNLPFKKTFVLIPSRHSTLVPSAIFKPEKKEEWLNFCVQHENDQLTFFNKVKMADAFNVFAVPAAVYTIINRQFPDPQFFHQHTPIIENGLSARATSNESASLMIHLNKDFFDVVVFEKGRLQLCNSFPIRSDNDFIYFTLLIFEQLKLEPAQTEVILSGWHPDFNGLYRHLANYIKNIRQTELPGSFVYSYHFKEFRSSGFYNLLSLAACV